MHILPRQFLHLAQALARVVLGVLGVKDQGQGMGTHDGQ
jgi:hypothetical protein